MEAYKEAIEISKIPRIPYKKILGQSLTQYVLDNKELTDDVLLHNILSSIKSNKSEVTLTWPEIVKNVKISLSARRAEQRTYG